MLLRKISGANKNPAFKKKTRPFQLRYFAKFFVSCVFAPRHSTVAFAGWVFSLPEKAALIVFLLPPVNGECRARFRG